MGGKNADLSFRHITYSYCYMLIFFTILVPSPILHLIKLS